MAADRVHLDAGHACPLCGALQHPFVKSPPPVTDSQRALQDQQAKLKTLHNVVERLKQQINSSEKILRETHKGKRSYKLFVHVG